MQSHAFFRRMQDFREFDPDVQAMGQCRSGSLEVACCGFNSHNADKNQRRSKTVNRMLVSVLPWHATTVFGQIGSPRSLAACDVQGILPREP